MYFRNNFDKVWPKLIVILIIVKALNGITSATIKQLNNWKRLKNNCINNYFFMKILSGTSNQKLSKEISKTTEAKTR